MENLNTFRNKLTLKRPNLWDIVLGLLSLSVILWIMKSLLEVLDIDVFYHPPLLVLGLVFVVLISIYNAAAKLNNESNDVFFENMDAENKKLKHEKQQLEKGIQDLKIQNGSLFEASELAKHQNEHIQRYIISVEEAQSQSLSLLKNERDILETNFNRYKKLWLDNEYKISKHDALLAENEKFVKDNERLLSENQGLESNNQRLVEDNKSLLLKNQELESKNQGLVTEGKFLESEKEDLVKVNEGILSKLKTLEAVLELLNTNQDILIEALSNEKLKLFLLNLFSFMSDNVEKKESWKHTKNAWSAFATSIGMTVNKTDGHE